MGGNVQLCYVDSGLCIEGIAICAS